VSFLFGLLGMGMAVPDLWKAREPATMVVWIVLGLLVALFVPFGGFALLVVSFPVIRWARNKQLDRVAEELKREEAEHAEAARGNGAPSP
jgi:hypothetical protein